ncbi:hypothetical protein DL796_03640 [Kangiella spongicola]|uniref:Uncharacterized protein n=2 Tax=Kangiella spongicola TaxID=796379 RepID=A0A318D4Q9_9GAMM|nr:hypothetical protein DL796_03640 [Kangiella spongicola]
MEPKETSKESEQLENRLTESSSTKKLTSSYENSSEKGVKKSDHANKKQTSDKKERLYTQEELDAAVSKAKIEMAEKVLRDTVSEEEITETVDSVVEAFEESQSNAQSSANEATINNYIHENQIYDKLVDKGVVFSGVECREAAYRLRFEVNATVDDIKKRMPKMFAISQQLESLDLIKDMEAVITNDFEGRSLYFYYY